VKLRSIAALVSLLVVAATAGCGGSGDDSTATAAASKTAETYVLGDWHGTLRQQGMPPFAVSADVGSLTDPQRNMVVYSVIRCAGNWTYRGFEQGAFRFTEVIDHGAGSGCKGVGEVSLTPRGPSTATYEFRGGGVVSHGTLQRRR
jgi:hypothetical protein